jgi:hypothetical protein
MTQKALQVAILLCQAAWMPLTLRVHLRVQGCLLQGSLVLRLLQGSMAWWGMEDLYIRQLSVPTTALCFQLRRIRLLASGVPHLRYVCIAHVPYLRYAYMNKIENIWVFLYAYACVCMHKYMYIYVSLYEEYVCLVSVPLRASVCTCLIHSACVHVPHLQRVRACA